MTERGTDLGHGIMILSQFIYCYYLFFINGTLHDTKHFIVYNLQLCCRSVFNSIHSIGSVSSKKSKFYQKLIHKN